MTTASYDGIGDRHQRLAGNWWAVLLRGVLGVLFGVVALLLPGIALGSLMLALAAYLLADGILSIVSAVRLARAHERWGWLAFEGVAGIIAGLVAAFLPLAALFVVVLLLSAWSIVSGAALIIAAIGLNNEHGCIWMVLAGLLSLIWGVLLAFAPIAGALVLTVWLGAYALVFGLLLIVLAFRLRARHAARL